MQKLLQTFLYIISFLLAVAVSIKNLREPDIWWQIRTGEWILANGKVPTVDIFSFTHQGKDWINIKWGFEVLAAMIAKHLGAESVFLLQIIVSVLILFFIKKILNLFNIDKASVFFVTTALLLFGIEFRIIGRPEMFSHLMVVVFLYLLLIYQKSKSKLIFLLIPLQVIWCNMHEAYAIGIAMLMIYIVIAWGKYFFLKKEKPMLVSLVTLASICAIAINPRGILLLTRPFNIFSQVQQNKYTTELDSIFTGDYWHKESYFFIGIALIFIFYFIKIFRANKSNLDKLIFPLEYIGICFAFLVLSMTAYRNIIFFLLAVTPVIAYLIHEKFKKTENYKLLFCMIGIGMYIFVVSNKYYEVTKSRDRFGLEVLSTNNPFGAANFIEQKGLKSKKCFSDYLTSSYFLWKLQPDFKTYIDLRDLDIFSTAFFDNYLEIVNRPEKFHEVDQKENFEYAVIYRNSTEALHQYLYTDSIYACTYVDAVAAVYQKTDDIPQGDIFARCTPIPNSSFSNFINKLFNPVYAYFDYDAANYDFEAAMYYATVGEISLAEKRINQYLQANPDDENARNLYSHITTLKSKIKK